MPHRGGEQRRRDDDLVALPEVARSGARARRNDAVEPVWLATLFACASTYIIVTGIVYNLLLRSIPIAGISDVWTNETLHVVIPLVLLLRRPPRGAAPPPPME